jgi:DNA replication protein DnaC
VCPVCQDAGWVAGPPKPGSWDFTLVACPSKTCRVQGEIRQRTVGEMFQRSAIPPLYAKASVEDFRSMPALVREVEVTLEAGRGLILRGDVGTGKTHLAVALLRRFMAEGRACLFVEVVNLLDTIRETYGQRTGPTDSDLLKAAATVDVLVLDDVGVETDTPWAREKLFQIVNERHNNVRLTIATTNLTRAALERPDRLGERTCSRLWGMCREITMNGKDRRVSR